VQVKTVNKNAPSVERKIKYLYFKLILKTNPNHNCIKHITTVAIWYLVAGRYTAAENTLLEHQVINPVLPLLW
jgi:hypothetical protein